MIDFGLSDDYLAGYTARLKGEPFDANKSDDWTMGWANAHQALKIKHEQDAENKIYIVQH